MAITIGPGPTDVLHMKRFNGTDVWRQLTPQDQENIGATAIELVVAWQDEAAAPDCPATRVTREAEERASTVADDLATLVVLAIPELGS
jgi:hypothetical protein